VALDEGPVGRDASAEQGRDTGKQHNRDEEIAGEVPPCAQQHVDDDEEREQEQRDERRPPEASRPAEDRHQRVRDLVVLLRRGRDDDGRKPGHTGPDDQRDRVHRPSIAPAELGLRQQRKAR
jgi:hypothetical protein